jgi:hypothetical protein
MNEFVMMLTIALVVLPGTASAQASSEDLRNRMKEGQKVAVIDDQGRKVQGRIVDLTPDSLALAAKGGRQEVRYAHIVTIDRVDDLKNGALIGLAVGVGLFALEAAVAAEDGLTLSATGYVAIGALYGGLGAGAGTGIDALIGGNRNIYRRGSGTRISIAPSIGRDRFGAAIGISW